MRTAPKALEDMSKALAEETITLIADGFREQRDPYGDKWTPKQAQDGRQTLVGQTARLKTGWHVQTASKRGFRVVPSVNYASAHQSPRPRARWGGKSLPRRMMIPTRDRGLPKAWAR